MTHWPLFTSLSGNRSTPAQVGPIVACVCCLVFCCTVGMMRVIGVLVWWISASLGGQIAYDDHVLTRWLAGIIGGVCMCTFAHVCVSVYASVLGRVKWVWIAISCDCSFRNIYWNSAHTHRDYGPPAGATGTKRFVAYVSDLRVCGIQQFSRTHYKSIHIISELSRHVVQVM